MSDERQAFEQLHAIPSGAIWCEKRHIYIHRNYSGLVLHPINEALEAFCEGARWQASRQALEGEPVAYITERKLEWLKSGPVLSAVVYRKHSEGSIPLYTHPASRQAVSVPEWIKCSDRLPAEYDGDFEGLVWVNDRDMTLPKYAQSRVHWSRVRGIAGYTHWMPTGFRRPQPPKQEGE